MTVLCSPLSIGKGKEGKGKKKGGKKKKKEMRGGGVRFRIDIA